jgi:signal transduction histidine kinase
MVWTISFSTILVCTFGFGCDETPEILGLFLFAMLKLVDADVADVLAVKLVHATQKRADERAQQELNSANDLATALRHAIGNCAHNLKTPLHAFRMGVEDIAPDLNRILCRLGAAGATEEMQLLKADASFSLNKLDNLSYMISFMSSTISTNIDFTKSSSGLKLQPSFSSVSLIEALKFPVVLMNSVQDEVPIISDLAFHPWTWLNRKVIVTDEQWLKENVLTLLSNAVKYSGQGRVGLRCFPYAAACSGAPMLRIEVLDDGKGVSKHERAALFQPFGQLQRRAGGLGLGLYSLAKRVEALDGTFGLDDKPDGSQGSMFWFSVPFKLDSSLLEVEEQSPTPLLSDAEAFVIAHTRPHLHEPLQTLQLKRPHTKNQMTPVYSDEKSAAVISAQLPRESRVLIIDASLMMLASS